MIIQQLKTHQLKKQKTQSSDWVFVCIYATLMFKLMFKFAR